MPLVASVLFFTPIIRDFVSWCGVRQVCSLFLAHEPHGLPVNSPLLTS